MTRQVIRLGDHAVSEIIHHAKGRHVDAALAQRLETGDAVLVAVCEHRPGDRPPEGAFGPVEDSAGLGNAPRRVHENDMVIGPDDQSVGRDTAPIRQLVGRGMHPHPVREPPDRNVRTHGRGCRAGRRRGFGGRLPAFVASGYRGQTRSSIGTDTSTMRISSGRPIRQ